MAKNVTLKSGTVFTPLTKAKEYFSDIRESVEPGSSASPSIKSDVIDLYERYCAATEWTIESTTDIIVDWDSRERPGGKFAQTKAYHRVDGMGEKHVFSIHSLV